MPTAKLTAAIVENARPSIKPYTIWDTELSGFGLRVYPSGKLSWIAKYRVGGGGRNAPVRCPSLGDARKVSAKDARAAAKKELAAAQLGGDPMAVIKAQRCEMTVEALISLYEKEGCFVQRGIRIGVPMKPLTKKYTLSRLRNHVVPLLGKKQISEVSSQDIESLGRAITIGKTSKDEKVGVRNRVIVKGGEGAARKVIRDLSAVFSFAMRRGLVKANPVTLASVRKTDNVRVRQLSMDELKRLGEALDELEKAGVNPKAVNIARLWALTGCRRDEIAGLQWSEVDFETGRLVLQNTKTGRSVRPLGGAAAILLAKLREGATADAVFVFPAERGEGFFQGTKRVWAQAILKAKLPGVTPHILRHTVGSLGASAGEGMLLVGAVLGHSNARSTLQYMHVASDPARLAADRLTTPVADALGLPMPASQEAAAS